jgi:hypothetical protein
VRDQLGLVATGVSLREESTLGITDAGGTLQPVATAQVLEGFVDVFAGAIHLGQGFSPDVHRRSFRRDVVVLSYELWTGAYGGDPDILGRTIAFSDGPAEVVGVTRQGFDLPARTEAWLNSRA